MNQSYQPVKCNRLHDLWHGFQFTGGSIYQDWYPHMESNFCPLWFEPHALRLTFGVQFFSIHWSSWATLLNKHKIRLRNIFLIQNNDLSESNPKCGSGMEETAEIAWFLSKLGWFFGAKNSLNLSSMIWMQDAQFRSRKLLLNACICS